MLRHKAAIQAARYAFSFSGIIDPEEAERSPDVITDAVVAPPPPAIVPANEETVIAEDMPDETPDVTALIEEIDTQMSAAKTTAERVAKLRADRDALGLKRLELYAHPEDWPAIKALAEKLQAHLSFLDKAGRDRIERDDALHAALAQDQQHFLGEIKVMRDDITAVITELRGTPQVTEQQSSNVTKLKAGE
jgi:hypothetical protein